MSKYGLSQFKDVLRRETKYQLSDEKLDQFLSDMTEERFNTNGVIVAAGEINNNVYICRKGIIRIVYNKNDKATTLSFGLPGTIVVPWYPFYMEQPSFFQYEACQKDTIVYKITKDKFYEYVNNDIEFARWYIDILEHQHFGYEKKLQTINGDAQTRLEAMMRLHPEIIKKVPQVMIASYLEITPQYLSNIRKMIVSKAGSVKSEK